jgi:Fur family transcriptional regulator, ferric uptake regulator
MTRAAHTPFAPVASIDEVAGLLRRAGGRFSAARRLLLEALFAADGPASAEQIASGLGGRGLEADLTSVYRNLEYLEELGVVRHVHAGHGAGLYALSRAPEREYLLCDACGTVTSVHPERLAAARELIQAEFGFAARFTHFPVSGVCAACREPGCQDRA